MLQTWNNYWNNNDSFDETENGSNVSDVTLTDLWLLASIDDIIDGNDSEDNNNEDDHKEEHDMSNHHNNPKSK